MRYMIMLALIMTALVLLTTAGYVIAKEYPKCDLYSPYRCVPTYGNKVVCGCGL
jgi:hypothetical protein